MLCTHSRSLGPTYWEHFQTSGRYRRPPCLQAVGSSPCNDPAPRRCVARKAGRDAEKFGSRSLCRTGNERDAPALISCAREAMGPRRIRYPTRTPVFAGHPAPSVTLAVAWRVPGVANEGSRPALRGGHGGNWRSLALNKGAQVFVVKSGRPQGTP